ncbi:DUF4817 domain-containing protein [Trichonephila clavipes]|uniref:DUF4817 domain-containing protein n=1 Tax=Trichonephila clavipes TaxID=2585209 RepID=A0A8X6RF94_TRICX|nr:DUF4817 domain-containing protein [Trichonephila clavipes]
MASVLKTAQCVLWFHETKLPIYVQRTFRRCYGSKPPGAKSIQRWYEMLKETGSDKDFPRSGRSSMCEETIEHIRQSFQRSSTKSTCEASCEVNISQTNLRGTRLPVGIDVLVRCHAEDTSRHSARTEAVYDEWIPSNDVFEKCVVSTISSSA